jgi:hypothetical protein
MSTRSLGLLWFDIIDWGEQLMTATRLFDIHQYHHDATLQRA